MEYRIVTGWNTISTKKAQSAPTVLTQKDTQSRESKKNVQLLPKITGEMAQCLKPLQEDQSLDSHTSHDARWAWQHTYFWPWKVNKGDL